MSLRYRSPACRACSCSVCRPPVRSRPTRLRDLVSGAGACVATAVWGFFAADLGAPILGAVISSLLRRSSSSPSRCPHASRPARLRPTPSRRKGGLGSVELSQLSSASCGVWPLVVSGVSLDVRRSDAELCDNRLRVGTSTLVRESASTAVYITRGRAWVFAPADPVGVPGRGPTGAVRPAPLRACTDLSEGSTTPAGGTTGDGRRLRTARAGLKSTGRRPPRSPPRRDHPRRPPAARDPGARRARPGRCHACPASSC